MGLLDTILFPFKELVKGAETAGKIFGVVIEMTEDVIKLIIDMMTEIENLFNASKIESIFFGPFKTASREAFKGIIDIFHLLKDIAPSTEGIEDSMTEAIDNVYKNMKSSTKNLKDEAKKIALELENTSFHLISTVENKFESFETILESFPDDLKEIKDKIAREFKVEKEKLFNIVPEFSGSARNESINNQHQITNSITTDVQSFKNVEQSIKTKFKNESDNVDLIYLFIVLSIIVFFACIYYFTKSIKVVGVVFAILLISFLIYIIHNFTL